MNGRKKNIKGGRKTFSYLVDDGLPVVAIGVGIELL